MRYAGIELDDVANGEGLGAVFFVQGCPHHCPGCQNPQTWEPSGGIPFDDELIFSIMQYFEDVPCASRLTISGGDPLWIHNLSLTLKIATLFKKYYPKNKLWIYTGFTWEQLLHRMTYEDNYIIENIENKEQILSKILELCDVLVDGRFVMKDRDVTALFRGSANQRIIDVKKSLESNELILWGGCK